VALIYFQKFTFPKTMLYHTPLALFAQQLLYLLTGWGIVAAPECNAGKAYSPCKCLILFCG
jgi:hypothetical protein